MSTADSSSAYVQKFQLIAEKHQTKALYYKFIFEEGILKSKFFLDTLTPAKPQMKWLVNDKIQFILYFGIQSNPYQQSNEQLHHVLPMTVHNVWRIRKECAPHTSPVGNRPEQCGNRSRHMCQSQIHLWWFLALDDAGTMYCTSYDIATIAF